MDRIKGVSPVKRAFWRRHWRPAVVLALLAAAPFAAFEGYKAWLRLDPEWRFVERVLLMNEIGHARGVVQRGTGPPKIKISGGTPLDRAFIESYVREVNEVTTGTLLSLSIVDDAMHNIEITFAADDEYRRMAQAFSDDPLPPSVGYFFVWPNKQHQIERAVAVVRSRLEGAERQSTIVHELTHTLGLVGHSPAFPESVVFASATEMSQSIRLSSIDRRLLRLLYTRLEPGAGWLQTRNAYTYFWTELAE